MFYTLYMQDSGRWRGIVDTLPDNLADDGIGALPMENKPDLDATMWSETDRMYVTRPTPSSPLVPIWKFLGRLGDSVLDAMQLQSVPQPADLPAIANKRASLRTVLLKLTVMPVIDVSDARWIAVVDALIAANIILAANRAAILAPEPV